MAPQETLERLIKAAFDHGDEEAPLLRELMNQLGLTQTEVETAFQGQLAGETNGTRWHLEACKIQTYNVPPDTGRHFEIITADGQHHKVGILFVDEFTYQSFHETRQTTQLRRRDWRLTAPGSVAAATGTASAKPDAATIVLDGNVVTQHQALYPGLSIKQLVTTFLKERIREREAQLKQLQQVEQLGLDLKSIFSKVQDKVHTQVDLDAVDQDKLAAAIADLISKMDPDQDSGQAPSPKPSRSRTRSSAKLR